MVVEYEMVCIWEIVAKAILLLGIHMLSVCISELGRILHNIRKFVYILYISESNDWGSCSARSFIYICLNVWLNQSGIRHLFKVLYEYTF